MEHQSHFNDIYWGYEPGQTGWIVTFHLVERPVIRTFDFDGMKSIQKSEILDRFKERKVGLSADSKYDPNKVQHAAVVLQEYRGRARPPVRHRGAAGSPGASGRRLHHLQGG